MVLLGVVLVIPLAVWPSGTEKASAGPAFEWYDFSKSEYGDIVDVAYGDGIWVAVGRNGVFIKSTDGITWLRYVMQETRDFYDVEYLNGTWIAVGESEMIYTSTNGEDWVLRRDFPSPWALTSVSLGKDQPNAAPVYVAVGEDGGSYTSMNAINWTQSSVSGAGSGLLDSAYGNDTFVAVEKQDPNPTVSTSVYGLTWTSESLEHSSAGITFASNEFVSASSVTDDVYSSPDGDSWTKHALSLQTAGTYELKDIEYNTDYSEVILLRQEPTGPSIAASAFAVTGNVNQSWNEDFITNKPGTTFNAIAAHGQYVVVVGDNGTIFVKGVTPSIDNTLKDLTLTNATLNETFAPGTHSYTATTTGNQTQVGVTAVTESVYATITINGLPAVSGQSFPVTLNSQGQPTFVDIVVTPQYGGVTQTYTLEITPDKESELTALSISKGELSPQFESERLYYYAQVASDVTNLDLTATARNSGATLEISRNVSNPVPLTSGSPFNVSLEEGGNYFEIKVTAPGNNPSTRTYEIQIIRDYSANLKNLEVNAGALAPPFTPLTRNYDVYVGNSVDEIEIKPTAESESAQITVNEVPTVSGDVYKMALQEGTNEIKVVVSNKSYNPKSINSPQLREPLPQNQVEYTVIVHRSGKEPNALLGTLAINQGTLMPTFNPDVTNYTATVTNSVYNIDVTVAPIDSTSTITVQGDPVTNGQSKTIPLNIGSNEITVIVTAANGTTIKTYKLIVTRQSAPVTPGPSDPGTPAPVTPTPTTPTPTTPTPPANGLEVLVNGQPTLVVATGGPAQVNGQTVFTATIDTARLTAFLNTTTGSPTVTIPVRTEADRVVAVLTGEAAALLISRNATLRIESPLGNYTIPASQIRLGTVASTLGLTAGSADLDVNVTIEKSSASVQSAFSQAAANEGFTVASEPIDFTITASAGGQTIEVNSFNQYVEREIPLSQNTTPEQVTTAVRIESNGTVSHVPTAVTTEDDTDYAVVNSLTNSDYALIWNPKQFSDVAGKWSQASVNDMASRLIVNGVGNDRYNPEGAVTRAEFAAILVRALGLPMATSQTTGFSDVSATDWYAGAAATANAYGLITGYPNGAFGPNDTITRQEAFAILDRATQIVPLQPSANASELSSYRDRADVASWARTSTQAILASGLVEGSGGWLRPEATLSRAESAAVAQRLLQQGGLID